MFEVFRLNKGVSLCEELKFEDVNQCQGTVNYREKNFNRIANSLGVAPCRNAEICA